MTNFKIALLIIASAISGILLWEFVPKAVVYIVENDVYDDTRTRAYADPEKVEKCRQIYASRETAKAR